MRVRETVIRPIGNSAGVTIPKETLEKYDLAPGDKIFLQETADGILVTRFDPLFQQAMASMENVGQGEKDKVMLDIQLENMKSDPDAVFKLQQREQGLRKRIQKEENDLALLKNNLEFFGRSKNADKMRSEFGAKINTSETEIAGLKSQLKQLRAALR